MDECQVVEADPSLGAVGETIRQGILCMHPHRCSKPRSLACAICVPGAGVHDWPLFVPGDHVPPVRLTEDTLGDRHLDVRAWFVLAPLFREHGLLIHFRAGLRFDERFDTCDGKTIQADGFHLRHVPLRSFGQCGFLVDLRT